MEREAGWWVSLLAVEEHFPGWEVRWDNSEGLYNLWVFESGQFLWILLTCSVQKLWLSPKANTCHHCFTHCLPSPRARVYPVLNWKLNLEASCWHEVEGKISHYTKILSHLELKASEDSTLEQSPQDELQWQPLVVIRGAPSFIPSMVETSGLRGLDLWPSDQSLPFSASHLLSLSHQPP